MTDPMVPSSRWRAHLAGAGGWIVPDAVFDGARLLNDAAIHVYKGRLRITQARAAPGDARAAGAVWQPPGILSPGFVDLQVNGGGGVLFNTTPSAEGARAIARAHRTTGTAAILPTVITDRPEVMEAACRAVAETVGTDGIAGIHIEGPHIALARRGTHATQYICPLGARTLQSVSRLRDLGVPVMITVAPEAVAPGQIATMTGQEVVVALGHSDATADQTRAALAEGARTFTHLFNAMSPMQNREAGVTGAAINSAAHASIICDGIHVAPEMLSLALRARPEPDRTFIVTDAMPSVAGPDHYDLYGQTISLRDGRLVNAEGALAGAHVTMLESVAFVIKVLHQTPEAALRMAITIPAGLMGLDHLCRLDGMSLTDLLLISPDFHRCTFVGG